MQAICILAHRDIAQVIHLARFLRSSFEVYIHFDTKCSLSAEDKRTLDEIGTHWIQEVDVRWGGWGIASATQLLFEMVLRDSRIRYVHVISGQDWQAIDPSKIYDFYEKTNKIYMMCREVGNHQKSGEKLIWWMQFYYPYDKINRRTLYGKVYHRFNILIQRLLHVNKLKKYNFKLIPYEGANWMDLPSDALEYVMEYYKNHPNIQKVFETSYCPDEYWIQTILCNSPLKDRIENDNHRYVKWEECYNSYPAILDEADYDEIVEGEYHFIRKVNGTISDTLIQKLMGRKIR